MNRFARVAVAATAIALIGIAYVAGRHAAYSQTQLEMDETSYHDYEKADAKLNALYPKLLHNYNPKEEVEAPTYKKIIAAEKAWITYRDAEANMEASIDAEGGSMYPQLFSINCTAITDDRIKTIKAELKELNSR